MYNYTVGEFARHEFTHLSFLMAENILKTENVVRSKLCKSNWNSAWNHTFPVFTLTYYMCENLHYESVYFKELPNDQEYYWPTIYRAEAAVVSTITSSLIAIPFLYMGMLIKSYVLLSPRRVDALGVIKNILHKMDHSIHIYKGDTYIECFCSK